MEKKRTRLITMIATVMIAMVFIVSGVAVRSFGSDDSINSSSPKSEQTTTPRAASVWDGSSDISWYDYSSNVFTLDTAAKLKGFADLSNSGMDFSSYEIRLGADIDLNNRPWSPIENFGGVFDGMSHSISNGLIVSNHNDGSAFFGTIDKISTIKNITFRNFTAKSETFCNYGIVVGKNVANGTTISNVNIHNCFIKTPYNGSNNGAFIAVKSSAPILIENCNVFNSMVRAGYGVAPIIVEMSGSAYRSVIRNCNIINTFAIDPGNEVGLFAKSGNALIENCHNNMYPVELTMESVKDNFTSEQIKIYNETMTANKRIAYAYTMGTGCEIVNCGGMLAEVSLDGANKVSLFEGKNYTFVDVVEYSKLGIGLDIDGEILIEVDGTVQKVSGKKSEVALTPGAHAITFAASINGTTFASGNLLLGLKNALSLVNENGMSIEQCDGYIGSDGTSFQVSQFDTSYTLKKVGAISGVTFASAAGEISESGEQLSYSAETFVHALALTVTYKGSSTQIQYEVWKGIKVAFSGNYPWTFVDGETNKYFRSTNQKKGSTQSDISFTVAANTKLSFEYACSSENNYDYLWFAPSNGATTNTKGANCSLATDEAVLGDSSVWKTYSIENTSGTSISLSVYYKKDSGGDTGADTAYIKNITATALDGGQTATVQSETFSEDTQISVPEGAIQYAENIYYVYETEKKIVYDDTKKQFATETDKAQNATVTFYITNSDIFAFEYDDTTFYDGKIDVYYDGVKQSLTGDKNSGISFLATYHRFDSVGTHSIKFEFTYYDWYDFALRNPKVYVNKLINVNVSVIGSGEVYDLIDFARTNLSAGIQKGLLNKVQLFAKPSTAGAYEYVGYRIKGEDGVYGDVIKSNGDIITLERDLDIQVEFKERLPLSNPISFTKLVNNVSSEGDIYAYQKIKHTVLQTNTEFILRSPAIDGAEVEVYDSATGKRISALFDNGEYFYKINDFTVNHTIEFIYTKLGYVDTKFVVDIIFEPSMSEYLIAEGSLPIEIVNDDELNYEYNPSLSSADRYAFSSSLANKKMDSIASNIAFKVQGMGVLVFDYYVNTGIKGEGYAEPGMGDKAFYGINTKIAANTEMLRYYNFITDAYKTKIGYMGADLGSDDYSKAQGALGWQRGAIAISGAENEITTIYIAYVKDSGDDPNFPSEDMFALANVMFVQGERTINFSSNTSTGSVTAKNGEVVINSGDKVAAGSQITFTATNTDSSAKFLGWYDSEGKLLSYSNVYTVSVSSDLTIRAAFSGEGANYFVGAQSYEKLSDAIESLKDGDSYKEGTIRVFGDISLSENTIIPMEVTLLLPYYANDMVGVSVGGTHARVSWNDGVKPFVTLTVEAGVTLTVNGKLIVGGVQHKADQSAQGHTSGDYSKFVNNGNVIINGSMDVRGLVDGSGTLTVNAGATLKQPFMVNNYSGGTNTSDLYGAGQFPFVQFDTVNVRCRQIINYGAKVLGSTSLYFWGGITTQDVVLVDKIENKETSGEGALIWLHSGSRLEISYDDTKKVDQAVGNIHLGDSGVNVIDVYGEITAGEFYLQAYGSSDMVLAIPYTYNFVIKGGAKVNVTQKYKVMPGAKVTIEEGGLIDIKSTGALYVYDGFKDGGKSGKLYPDASVLSKYGFSKNAVLTVNGTLNIDGAFAGIAQSSSTTGTIIVGSGEAVRVGTQTITEGSDGGYTDNRATFTMSGRVYGLNGFKELSACKTYKCFAADEFTLNSFTNVYYEGESGSSTQKTFKDDNYNQACVGKFAEFKDGKYTGIITLIFDKEFENKDVIIDGVLYNVFNGTIELPVTFDVSLKYTVSYYTVEFETANSAHSEILDLKEGAECKLNKIVKSVVLRGDNVYERAYKADGSINTEFVLKAAIAYSDGTSEDIVLTIGGLDESKYVSEVTLSNPLYTVEFGATLKTFKAELAEYIDGYNNIKADVSTDGSVVEKAKALYASYMAIVSGLDSVQLEYVNGKIGSLNDYAKIVKSVSLKMGASVTYGDTEADVTATYVDGTTGEFKAAISDYAIDSANRITYNLTYSGVYGAATYSITAKESGASKKTIYLTVSGDGTFVYDGSLRSVTVSVNGAIEGNPVVLDGISSANVCEKSVTFALKGDNALWYVLDKEYTAVLKITKRAITVSIEDKTSAYGEEMLALTAKVTSGELVGEEKLSEIVTLSKAAGVNAGTYAISGAVNNNAVAANYNVTFVGSNGSEGVYTITKRAITVSIEDKTSVYGEEMLALTSKVTSGELVGEEKLSEIVTLSKAAGVNAGTYAISGAVNNNAVAANYNVTIVGSNGSDGVYTITKRAITVTVEDHADMMLSRSNLIIFNTNETEVEIIGYQMFIGETLIASVTVDGKVTVVEGQNIVPAVYGVRAIIADNNYDVTYVDGSITIVEDNKYYTVNVNFDRESGLEYNGNVVKITVDAIITDTKENVSYSMKIYSMNNEVSEIKNAGVYKVEIAIDDILYEYSFVITKRAITVSIEDKTSAYGEEMLALTSKVTSGELVGEEKLSEIVTLSKAAGVNAGTYAISGAVNNNAVAANYNVTFVGSNGSEGVYTITKRAITVSIEDKTSVYGEEMLVLTSKVTSGELVGEEKLSEIVTLSKAAGVNAGTYAISGAVNNNAVAANYNVTFVGSNGSEGVYTITKRAITVSIEDKTSVYGEEMLVLTAKVTSGELVGEEKLSEIVTLSKAAGVNAGTYAISGAVNNNAVAANYNVTIVGSNGNEGVYTITKRAITVTVKNANSVYGENLADISSGYDLSEGSMAPGESLDFISLEIEKKAGETEIRNAGTYSIIGKSLNGNYAVKFVGQDGKNDYGVYTIAKREITVTIDNKTSVYGENEVALTASVTGAIKLAAWDSNLYSVISLKKAEGKNVGSYAIDLTVANDNYSVTYNKNAVYTITARSVTVTVNDAASVYGNAESQLTATANLAKGDESKLYDIVELKRENGSMAGIYKITASVKDTQIAKNYVVKIVYSGESNGVYEIKARPVTIKINSVEVNSKDDFNAVVAKFGFAVTEGNIVNGDNLGVTYKILDGTTEWTKDNYMLVRRTGVFELKGYVSNPNYSVTVVDGTLTMTKPKIKINKDLNKTVTYDGNVVEFFNYKQDIDGLFDSTTADFFAVEITKNGETVNEIVGAGVYTVKVRLVYSTSYEWEDENADAPFTVTVLRADISDCISFDNVSEDTVIAASKSFMPTVNFGEFTDVVGEDYALELIFVSGGNKSVNVCAVSGKYKFKVIIDEKDHCGEAEIEFTVAIGGKEAIETFHSMLQNLADQNVAALIEIREFLNSLDEYSLTVVKYTEDFQTYSQKWTSVANDSERDMNLVKKITEKMNLANLLMSLISVAGAVIIKRLWK
mgnify:FL=1